jgi:hypothetical protein
MRCVSFSTECVLPTRAHGSEDLLRLFICGVDHTKLVTSVSSRVIFCKMLPGQGTGSIVVQFTFFSNILFFSSFLYFVCPRQVMSRSGGVGSSTVSYKYERKLVTDAASKTPSQDDLSSDGEGAFRALC